MSVPGGLRDAHLHLAEHGAYLGAVHLHDCPSLDDCLARISAAAVGAPLERWIVARGARAHAWPQLRLPSAQELHHASGGRPTVVVGFDHHSCAASHAALAAAGIDRDTPDCPDGIIERDHRGVPTGVLLEGAHKRMLEAMPGASDSEYEEHLTRAQQDPLRQGFVEIHDMMASARLADALHAIDLRGELRLSVVLFATPDKFDALRAWFATTRASAKIRFGGLKLFLDGTLNSRTAAMLHPYADPIADHPRGTLLCTDRQLDLCCARAASEGFDIATHAIGDAAVRQMLDAYARVSTPRPFRLRIEHAQFVDPVDLPRLARMGVVASVQPCHLLTDIEAVHRLVPHREPCAFPVRSLVESAVSAGFRPEDLVWFGSDTPVVPPAPADNIQASVRRRRNIPDSPSVAPEQAISEDLAWRLMRSPLAHAAVGRDDASAASGSV